MDALLRLGFLYNVPSSQKASTQPLAFLTQCNFQCASNCSRGITSPSPSLNNGSTGNHTACAYLHNIHTQLTFELKKKTCCIILRSKGQLFRVPLPVLGGSAMGKSKVIAGSHFGIFTKPAGHCGGQTYRITLS